MTDRTVPLTDLTDSGTISDEVTIQLLMERLNYLENQRKERNKRAVEYQKRRYHADPEFRAKRIQNTLRCIARRKEAARAAAAAELSQQTPGATN